MTIRDKISLLKMFIAADLFYICYLFTCGYCGETGAKIFIAAFNTVIVSFAFYYTYLFLKNTLTEEMKAKIQAYVICSILVLIVFAVEFWILTL